jgi:hypothetical protein
MSDYLDAMDDTAVTVLLMDTVADDGVVALVSGVTDPIPPRVLAALGPKMLLHADHGRGPGDHQRLAAARRTQRVA